ncbi:hypothetical protein [Magnetospirillum fulvum]|uniref:DUF1269 domain-containing protein n=1 Tax=Magnetospirillum fulvum TaxID=1082 RepID=A0A1H6HAD3_MAGFU|nr:hypothetical protein [Magnetospirillum fulvum]SEH31214.1 hypothetical protein SAMN04244559_01107 [Magnetospirillum fulvum]
MDEYLHHVSGFFARREDAEAAIIALVAQGLPRERIYLFHADAAPPAPAPQAHSDSVLKDVLVNGAIGTAVGTGLGALTELALVAANVSLFVASPLIAPLMLLGWGASLGGLIGATTGVAATDGQKEGLIADLINDAVSSGQTVLVAVSRTERETSIAREVIAAAVGEYKDIDRQ